MSAFLAIVTDTWRQSKQQSVFMILILLMFLTAVAVTVLPRVHVDDAGNKSFGLLLMDEPTDALARGWTGVYAQTLVTQGDGASDSFSEGGAERRDLQKRAQARAEEYAESVPPFQRSVEMLLYGGAVAVRMISMLMFIAACAGYFPDLLTSGAVDVVLAKPISRLQIYMGKYVGGLLLFSVLLAATYALMFVGVGARTGVWHLKLLQALPLQLFSAAVLFAILALLGVLRRSATLAMLVGYFFYVVVDSILGQVMQAQRMGLLERWGWLDRSVELLRFGLPNFTLLNDLSSNSVLNIPSLEWTPLLVAAAWMVVALGLGHLKFRSTDF